ncbi:MAG: 3-dehydroquinate synthase [Saprospiraceae bacterium]|nr:3-dehydroquinate synthase [Saprospiraceae bacterium]MBK8371925.1 3-dehydroquinate synthase [Saprospiraceae bacterium]MBK8547196.1 3-dehydroquinate synthase [Saprospiraceae bacterium]MBK8818406.1 3-dehydroquinate synthase [Saprospiraceae bacterium]MBK8853181.1 3-dehydroquinate synthase [Saprospiraceae bacterium]
MILTDTKPKNYISAAQYQVHFEDWDTLRSIIEDPIYSQVLVIADENTEKLCLHILFENIARQVRVLTFPAGEKHKNLMTCHMIFEKMLQKNIDRNCLVVLLGGGVVGDMGGFCSATFKRGLPFIYLPTTLLSQVDASIGGKLGVDVNGIKNVAGIFQNPKNVFVFTEFLQTLPEIHIRNGFAEMIKHWLIADRETFDTAHAHRDFIYKNYKNCIESSLQIKLNITEKDPKEKGIRKILNFGHTIGHAIESLSILKSEDLLHGEAIAIGMICESYISYRMNLLSEEEIFKIREYIISIFGHHPKWVNDPAFLVELMYHDKKNRNGKIQFSLLEGIGYAVYNWEIPEDIIYESLYFYKQKL